MSMQISAMSIADEHAAQSMSIADERDELSFFEFASLCAVRRLLCKGKVIFATCRYDGHSNLSNSFVSAPIFLIHMCPRQSFYFILVLDRTVSVSVSVPTVLIYGESD